MFDVVYKIAMESNNFEQLKVRLKKLHIDAPTIKNGFTVTAGSQLAIEGNDDRVEWMRQLGASVTYIVHGYAQVGAHEKVELYRNHHGASVSAIAHGYALAGHHEKVEIYRTQHGANVNEIAHGYAIAGYHEKVEAYHIEHGAHVNDIAHGYARAGDHKNAEIYHKQHGASVSAIAHGYALAGNHEKVEIYRTQHGAHVNDIAHGYALACAHEKVMTYHIEYGAHANDIAQGYALAGDRENQKKYDINYLLDSYLKERTAMTDSSKVTKEYFHGSFFSIFQKSFSQKREAVNALKSALRGDNVDLSEHLSILRNGNLGKELRVFVKSGMGNTLVGKEVTTVSDFVKVLRDKNTKVVERINYA